MAQRAVKLRTYTLTKVSVMTAPKNSDQVRGKTIRLTWTDGPTRGATHEHLFHEDGTVEWRSVGNDQKTDRKKGAAKSGTKADKQADRPAYLAMRVTDAVCMVSYLSQSGFTLTVVLNFSDQSIAGVASNEKSWSPVRGHFDVVGAVSEVARNPRRTAAH
jgi:hypothetical protein